LDEDLDCTSEFFAFKAENCGPKHREYRKRHAEEDCNEEWEKSLIQFELYSNDEKIRETQRFHWRD